MKGLNTHVMNATIVMALYVLSFQLVEFLVVPFQNAFTASEFASLLFLPHGVRVLTVILYGARSGFIYLLVASALLLFLSDEGAKTDLTVVLQTLTSAACVPLSMLLLRFGFGENSISLSDISPKTWRALVVLIVVSSLLNGLMQTAAIQLGNTSEDDFIVALKYTVGDVFGITCGICSRELRTAPRTVITPRLARSGCAPCP